MRLRSSKPIGHEAERSMGRTTWSYSATSRDDLRVISTVVLTTVVPLAANAQALRPHLRSDAEGNAASLAQAEPRSLHVEECSRNRIGQPGICKGYLAYPGLREIADACWKHRAHHCQLCGVKRRIVVRWIDRFERALEYIVYCRSAGDEPWILEVREHLGALCCIGHIMQRKQIAPIACSAWSVARDRLRRLTRT